MLLICALLGPPLSLHSYSMFVPPRVRWGHRRIGDRWRVFNEYQTVSEVCICRRVTVYCTMYRPRTKERYKRERECAGEGRWGGREREREEGKPEKEHSDTKPCCNNSQTCYTMNRPKWLRNGMLSHFSPRSPSFSLVSPLTLAAFVQDLDPIEIWDGVTRYRGHTFKTRNIKFIFCFDDRYVPPPLLMPRPYNATGIYLPLYLSLSFSPTSALFFLTNHNISRA